MNLRKYILFLFLIFSGYLNISFAQSSFEPFIINSLPILSSIEAEGWKIVEVKMGYTRGKVSISKNLKEGKTYGFYASGNRKIADIDVSVYQIKDDKIKLFKKEDESGKDATLIFEVKKTGLYRFYIDVVSFSSENKFGLYNMIFFSK
jgi:hypothetical protein